MKNTEIASSALRQAEDRLKTARTALRSGNLSYAVRSSQECVELSLKAALRLVGVEFPKVHDVSRVLAASKSRFPAWFDAERFAKTSRTLAEKRGPAMYGDEIRLTPSEQLFSREWTAEMVRGAAEIAGACGKLIESRSPSR